MPVALAGQTGRPILEYTLTSLPSSVKEVIIVIGYLGEQIKNRFGNSFGKLYIRYAEAKELNGTGGAVWTAKPYLKNKFLVLNGDDIYSRTELESLIKNTPWSAGLAKAIPPGSKYLTFELDNKGRILGARYPNEKEMKNGILISTGAFLLDKDIFKYKLVPIGEGKEYGLPQTILKGIKKHPTRGVLMREWLQINSPEDIKKAEKALASKT